MSAEELNLYLERNGVRCNYIHSDIDTLERVRILDELRAGMFDVLIGVNLLREGLDLPQVSLVAILDADKEGFLRSETSLVQTIGRAARNANGKVIMYADTVTRSMKGAIDEAEKIAATLPSAFIPSQFSNPANPNAHYLSTGPEIWNDTNGKIDIFVAGIGTGGTLSGVAKYLKEKNYYIK